MKNLEISEIFSKMADILELKDDNIFKINAYRKASRTLKDLQDDVQDLQKSDSLKKVQIFLNRILIDGNDVTEDEVILRELTIKENSYINLDDLQNDVLRIYNLGLFTKVDLIPIPLGGNKIDIIIDVEESFYPSLFRCFCDVKVEGR